MDRVEIRGLTVLTLVGVLPHEREMEQPVTIDLDLMVDLHDAGLSDELGDTANYGAVAEQVAALVRESKDQLLERLAERICALALTFAHVESVDVTVTKMRPPIPENLTSTGVRLHRTRDADTSVETNRRRAFLALGSNLGDRIEFLRLAVDQLPDVVRTSQVFETDPIGGPGGQRPYLNMVAEIATELDPYALLRRCRHIERQAMRQRVEHWGPRTLDIDVLLYDGVMISDPELTIPHPRYAERRFVLAPLAELAPELCPPGWDDTLPPEGIHPRGPLG